MNEPVSKNDDNTSPTLQDRITLIDCLKINAAQQFQSREAFVQPQNDRAVKRISPAKLRAIFDDLLGILEDSSFDDEK